MKKTLFGSIKKHKSPSFAPHPGCYYLEGAEHWEKCRDVFEKQVNEKIENEKIEGFFFNHKGDHQTIAEFLNRTEQVLNLENLNSPWRYSKYNPTTRPDVLWIQPSEFWMCCRMRRSLLTVLLRAGMNYVDATNYDEAMQSVWYVRETKLAVMRFLLGFNRFVGDCERGWVGTFRNRREDEIKDILVLPEEEKFPLNYVNLGTLWG